MSAIHVIGGSISNDQLTNYTYAFHIPTNADAALQAKAQQDPLVSGFESVVPGIDAAEFAGWFVRAQLRVESLDRIERLLG